MADRNERLQKIASAFGDSDISIYYKRDKVYPDKPVSEQTIDKIEAALRAPELEPSTLRVMEGKEVLYRSHQGSVTNDVKGIAVDFQTAIKSPEQAQYFELLNARLANAGESPYTPQSLRAEIDQQSRDFLMPDYGNTFDEIVVRGAAEQGLTREATQKILAESPALEAFLRSKPEAAALEKYHAPVKRELERVLPKPQAQVQPQSVEPSLPQPQVERSSVMSPPTINAPQTSEQAIQAALEPKLSEQLRQQAPAQAERGGAIVLSNQSKALIPIEPTPQQLNEKMPEVLSPKPTVVAASVSQPIANPELTATLPQPVASVSNESLEKALAAATAKIDSLQSQLNKTQGALDDLSKHVKESSLKTWATSTVSKVSKTVQTIAAQAKTTVGDWVAQAKTTVEQKLTQAKTQAQQSVSQVKTVASDRVNQVTSAVQNKTIEVRESVRHRLNDALTPINPEALTATANRVISEWGRDGKFEGKSFDFHRSPSGDVSIHTKDGKPVFQNGVISRNADPQTIAHLAKLPSRLEAVQKITPTQAPSTVKAFAR